MSGADEDPRVWKLVLFRGNPANGFSRRASQASGEHHYNPQFDDSSPRSQCDSDSSVPSDAEGFVACLRMELDWKPEDFLAQFLGFSGTH